MDAENKKKLREKKIQTATFIGIAVNLIIGTIKIICGMLSNSVAIISDGANNATDTLSSFVTLFGLKLANKRPDKGHPLGHGRFEYISALIVSFIVLGTGLIFLKDSVNAILTKQSAVVSGYMIIIISFTVLIKIALCFINRKIGEEADSQALKASASDALSDALASSITIASSFISKFTSFPIDGCAGIAVSVFIMLNGYFSLRDTISSILGERPQKETVNKIRSIIEKHHPLHGGYDLMLHQYGPELSIGTCNVEVPSDATAEEIFDAMTDAQHEIYNTMGIYLTLGMYAVNDKNPTVIKMKDDILDTLKCIDKSVLSIHGFHVHFKSSMVHFDVVVDFALKDKKDFERRAVDVLRKCYPQFSFEFNIDPDYS